MITFAKNCDLFGFRIRGTEGIIRGDLNKETVQKQTAIGILVIDVQTAV